MVDICLLVPKEFVCEHDAHGRRERDSRRV